MEDSKLISEICDSEILETKPIVYEENGDIFMKLRRSKYKIKFPNIDEYVSYLIGVIYGGGNMSLVPRKSMDKYPRTKLRIYNASVPYISLLNRIFEEKFNIRGIVFKEKHTNCFVLEFNSKSIWLYFNKNANAKAQKKDYLEVPSCVKSVSLFRHFVAGLWDTDGYFNRVFGIMLSGTNKNFLNEIKNLCFNYYNLKFLGAI